MEHEFTAEIGCNTRVTTLHQPGPEEEVADPESKIIFLRTSCSGCGVHLGDRPVPRQAQ